ncbi:hypothetical protein CHISP_3036 [Chitinispirillum alkaliphilum]|nr:hypothetical protein CHISP_3036 [Chitinispirillum alkaliphilum]
MTPVIIEKISEQEIESRGIGEWPIWTKEVSRFPWQYDQTEQCLILEGDVVVRVGEEEFRIRKGDFVTFARGVSCEWEILSPVRKHYNFS